MAYTSQAIITSYLNGRDIIPFLDDDSDGQADTGLLDEIIATCSMECDGYVASIYPTPFASPAPAAIQSAAAVFVCEALYARRLTPDEKNPFKARADMWRKTLQKVGEDGSGLDYKLDRAFEPGAVVGTDVVFNQTTM